MTIYLIDNIDFKDITEFENIGAYVRFVSAGNHYNVPWTSILYIKGRR